MNASRPGIKYKSRSLLNSSITRELVLDYFGRKSEMINLIVVDLHHSDRNKNVLIIYHSGVDMQHSLTFALVGAYQRAIT
ncbi:MAG: hypothetical protein GY893_00665 [bacterium]|nr:hypothetical protein [bacterium]